ncbi:tetratricopeptide repeat protein [Flammeovirgaceae bacterium SG7u.111]|nr:tetratricopeptide repeat protein [Flammeovirgaceae bacterium SG7u.132]WPO34804.1 tetratricopeptide repeat protein [Flammeovirgaceae bacterium SG7u.111]
MKNNLIYIFALLLTLSACGPTPEELISEGKNRLRDGKFSEAASLIAEAVKADPQNHDAFNALGVAYYNLEENGKAMEAFNSAITLFQQDYKYYFNRGNVNRKLNQPEKAIEDYSNAIALDATHYDIFLNRGLSYMTENKLAEALNDFQKASQLDRSQDKNVSYYFALTLLRFDRFEEAQKALLTSIAIDPDFAEAYHQLALAELGIQKGASPEVCRYLAKAIELGYQPSLEYSKTYCE